MAGYKSVLHDLTAVSPYSLYNSGSSLRTLYPEAVDKFVPLHPYIVTFGKECE